MREIPKNLFRFLIVLNIGAAVLLGILFLGSFLLGGERLDSEMKAFFGEKTEFVDSYELSFRMDPMRCLTTFLQEQE